MLRSAVRYFSLFFDMNTYKAGIITSLLVLAPLNPASADFVGLNIGANRWTPDISGSFSSKNGSSIQLQNDLGYKDDSSTNLTVSLEHPVPFLPNIKYSGYDLNASSAKNSTSTFTFNNKDYTGNINSTLDLSHKDIVLYYQLLDNWVNLDLGLDFKKFDGKVSMASDTTSTESITVDETIPMLYLAARFDLPLTGMYVGANIQQLSIGDSSSEDTTLMVGYESKSGLGVEGGIKTFSLDLQDSNKLNTNLEYDGIYLNGYFHF
jgi:outer membrane protein